MSRLSVLIGTGTSVGKTYVAERLLRAFASEGHAALGYKPVESGVTEASNTDIARLARASTFHIEPGLRSLTLSAPVSPHLAARLEGREIDVATIRAEILRGCASRGGSLIVELPGGAFSPLTEKMSGADFARSLPGARVLLVALNRLGVLHDVGAATRAAAAVGLPLLGIVLNDPEVPDESTATNANELRTVTRLPVLTHLPRLAADAPVASGDPALALARRLRGD